MVVNPKYFGVPLSGVSELSSLRSLCFSSSEFEFSGPELNILTISLDAPSLNIHELDVQGVTWPDYHFVAEISATFSKLRILKMSADHSWCGLCNTCSPVSFHAMGDRTLVYEDGKGLPVSY